MRTLSFIYYGIRHSAQSYAGPTGKGGPYASLKSFVPVIVAMVSIVTACAPEATRSQDDDIEAIRQADLAWSAAQASDGNGSPIRVAALIY